MDGSFKKLRFIALNHLITFNRTHKLAARKLSNSDKIHLEKF